MVVSSKKWYQLLPPLPHLHLRCWVTLCWRFGSSWLLCVISVGTLTGNLKLLKSLKLQLGNSGLLLITQHIVILTSLSCMCFTISCSLDHPDLLAGSLSKRLIWQHPLYCCPEIKSCVALFQKAFWICRYAAISLIVCDCDYPRLHLDLGYCINAFNI